MIIYPLPAQELDDATLSRQIKNIAQVLCNVHHFSISAKKLAPFDAFARILIPLNASKSNKYDNWVKECRVNYLKLVEMGCQCCVEWMDRFKELPVGFRSKLNNHKFQPVVEWASENVPELPIIPEDCHIESRRELEKNNIIPGAMPFPLVMPEKYIVLGKKDKNLGRVEHFNTGEKSYRDYYKAKLSKKINKLDCNNLPVIDTDPDYPKWTRREAPDYIQQLLVL